MNLAGMAVKIARLISMHVTILAGPREADYSAVAPHFLVGWWPHVSACVVSLDALA